VAPRERPGRPATRKGGRGIGVSKEAREPPRPSPASAEEGGRPDLPPSALRQAGETPEEPDRSAVRPTGGLQSGNGEQPKSRQDVREGELPAARASGLPAVCCEPSGRLWCPRSPLSSYLCGAADCWPVQRSGNCPRGLKSPRAACGRRVGFQRPAIGAPGPGGLSASRAVASSPLWRRRRPWRAGPPFEEDRGDRPRRTATPDFDSVQAARLRAAETGFTDAARKVSRRTPTPGVSDPPDSSVPLP